MSETRRIQALLRSTFDGDAWHGAPVWELVGGLSAEQAAAHPLAGAHSIWELVLHMTYWRRVTVIALDGESIAASQTDDDWSAVPEPSAAAWEEARAALRRSQDEILAALDDCDDERLKAEVVGRDYSFYFLLHGIVQHDLYHGGQIALLRKAL